MTAARSGGIESRALRTGMMAQARMADPSWLATAQEVRAMDPLLLVLRLVHVVAGVLWVGGAVFVFRHVEPTAKELGPRAEPFMTRLVEIQRIGIYFMILSGLTVVAGTWLFWIDSAGDPIGWITRDATGMAFGIGGLAAWIAFILGVVAVKPAVDEISAAGAAMRDAGGPPGPELVTRMEAAQARMATLGQVDFVLLAIAVVTMAIARYL